MPTEIEKAYGVIPFSLEEANERKVLLIQQRAGFFGFPKGHKEGFEDDLSVAIRELKEETCLEPHLLLSSEPLVDHYTYKKEGIERQKEVYYYPMLVFGDLSIQKEELLFAGWFSLEEAKKRLTYPSASILLEKAAQFLRKL